MVESKKKISDSNRYRRHQMICSCVAVPVAKCVCVYACKTVKCVHKLRCESFICFFLYFFPTPAIITVCCFVDVVIGRDESVLISSHLSRVDSLLINLPWTKCFVCSFRRKYRNHAMHAYIAHSFRIRLFNHSDATCSEHSTLCSACTNGVHQSIE